MPPSKRRRKSSGRKKSSPPIGPRYQVVQIPKVEPYPLEDDEWRDVGTRLDLNDVNVLVSHNFFEESRGRLMERIARFLKAHPVVTDEAVEALYASGLQDHIRVRGGRWYVYRGG